MESLTVYQANKTRVGARTVKRDMAGSGMASLTDCHAKTRVGVRTVRRVTAGPAMESLTNCQANRTRVGVRTVRRDTAGPDMESLTAYQANRTRVGMRTVRRDTAGPAMESLTNCQANRTRVRPVRREIARLLYASNCVWHPPQYFSFQSFLVIFYCVDTIQLFTIYSAHQAILIYFPYLLTAYSIFSTMLACWVDTTSFCNSSSSSASDVLLKSGVQSAHSLFISVLSCLYQDNCNTRSLLITYLTWPHSLLGGTCCCLALFQVSPSTYSASVLHNLILLALLPSLSSDALS